MFKGGLTKYLQREETANLVKFQDLIKTSLSDYNYVSSYPSTNVFKFLLEM